MDIGQVCHVDPTCAGTGHLCQDPIVTLLVSHHVTYRCMHVPAHVNHTPGNPKSGIDVHLILYFHWTASQAYKTQHTEPDNREMTRKTAISVWGFAVLPTLPEFPGVSLVLQLMFLELPTPGTFTEHHGIS